MHTFTGHTHQSDNFYDTDDEEEIQKAWDDSLPEPVPCVSRPPPEPAPAPLPKQRCPAYLRQVERRAAMRNEGVMDRILFRTRIAVGPEVAVTASDMLSLAPGIQVSDGVVDVFGSILQDHYKGKVCYFTIFTMMKLRHDSARCAADIEGKCRDIFQKSTVLFPLHLGPSQNGHWCLITFTPATNTLREYNSLSKCYRSEIEANVLIIKRMLCTLHKRIFEPRTGTEWYRPLDLSSGVVHVECPQQPKGSEDCGVFTCGYALHACEAKEDDAVAITQSAILQMRDDISKIIHRGFLTE